MSESTDLFKTLIDCKWLMTHAFYEWVTESFKQFIHKHRFVQEQKTTIMLHGYVQWLILMTLFGNYLFGCKKDNNCYKYIYNKSLILT